MKILLTMLAFSLISTMSFAATSASKSTQSKVMNNQNKGTLDVTPTSKKDEVADDTPLVMNSEGVRVDITCKSHDGQILKQGDKGYDKCLKNVKKDKTKKDNIKVDFKK